MKIVDIPFNRHIALESCDDDRGVMCLRYSPEMTNHLGTMHASAQFALAEACSGRFMLGTFPEYADDYVAVLRKSEVKYRRQTRDTIYAMAATEERDIALFRSRLERKDRAVLSVRVTVRDATEEVAMDGTFDWYVQKREMERAGG